jgi:dolichyl-phosphate beta-glucosyltransferase
VFPRLADNEVEGERCREPRRSSVEKRETMARTVGLIIPCYNEGKRLPVEEFVEFLSSDGSCHLFFVDDGSTDSTGKKIETIRVRHEDRVDVVTLSANCGKAEAVRQGMLRAAEGGKYEYVGFMDADLAAPLSEVEFLCRHLDADGKVKMAFGSRMAKMGSAIERKTYRHMIGRVVASVISRVLRIRVYDTQCGAKFLRASEVELLFREKFLTSWLFDVEMFARLIGRYGRETVEETVVECPLNRWVDKGTSKVPFSYGFKVFWDLWKIKRFYRT